MSFFFESHNALDRLPKMLLQLLLSDFLSTIASTSYFQVQYYIRIDGHVYYSNA